MAFQTLNTLSIFDLLMGPGALRETPQQQDAPSSLNPIRILVLDGGDLRVVSQMVILEEIMSRVAWDRKEDSVLPCKYFDMIVGVGAGGLLAILLGVLEMTIDMTLDEFICIYKLVFDNHDLEPAARSEILETAMVSLLKRRGIPQDQKLLGTGTCHTFVCSVSINHWNNCRRLRNYRARGSSLDITIIEAVRATWASPGLFTPIFLGNLNFQEEFVGGDCVFSNPTKQATHEAYSILDPTRSVGSIISLGTSMPRQAAFTLKSETSQPRLSEQVVFFDPESVALELKDQLKQAGIYHRYAIHPSQEALYSLHSDTVPRIVSETKSFISTVDFELNEGIRELPSHSNVTTRDIHRAWNFAGPPPSSRGFPLLSPYFVPRADVMGKMETALFGLDDAGMKIMTVIGMGGSGKTQSIAKFMRIHQKRFSSVFFINATSALTIEAGLLQRVYEHEGLRAGKTLSDALSIFAEANWMGNRWAIIYDGADDPNLDMARFIPRHDNGTIVITSRNQNLQLLSPLGCVQLDSMATEDAVALLLKTALPFVSDHSATDRLHARAIVEELDCLALAVSQAGCHIQMQGGIDNYVDRLRNNRSSLLHRPIGAQRIEGHRSIYAAFDVMVPALSRRALEMLSTLSFLNPKNIPLDLLFLAAERRFASEPAQLLPDLSSSELSAERLSRLFTPSTIPQEEGIWALLDELQQYSLVRYSKPQMGGNLSLRFHNMVFAWARDRLSTSERTEYRSLAIQLLVCCITEANEDFFQNLLPHVQLFYPLWDVVHVNDRANFAKVIGHCGQASDLQKICNSIYDEVLRACGLDHLQTSEAALYLADACRKNNQPDRAATLESEVVSLRVRTLGRDHHYTMDAIGAQARGYYEQGNLGQAEPLQREVLQFRRICADGKKMDLARSMVDLMDTLTAGSLYPQEARELWREASKISFAELGRNHWRSRRLQPLTSACMVPGKTKEQRCSEECFAILGRSSNYLLAAKCLGPVRWGVFLEEQIRRHQQDPELLKNIETLAATFYQSRDTGVLPLILEDLALELSTKADGLAHLATPALKGLRSIPEARVSYRYQVEQWAIRHKQVSMTVDFAEGGLKDARRHMCIYNLDNSIECVGQWKRRKDAAQESAAKELFKILQVWGSSA